MIVDLTNTEYTQHPYAYNRAILPKYSVINGDYSYLLDREPLTFCYRIRVMELAFIIETNDLYFRFLCFAIGNPLNQKKEDRLLGKIDIKRNSYSHGCDKKIIEMLLTKLLPGVTILDE